MANEKFYNDLVQNIKGQYRECKGYRLLCQTQNFSPYSNLKTKSDLKDVPFLVTTLFKKSNKLYPKLLRVNSERLTKWTVSSSTTGDPSVVGRTENDMAELQKVIKLSSDALKPRYGYDCIFFPEPYTMRMYHSENLLGKPTESYIGNVLNSFQFSDETEFLLKKADDGFYLDTDEFIRFLQRHDNKNHSVSIRGSTLLLYNTIQTLKKNMPSFHLGSKALIHTGGGGWDGKKGSISIGKQIMRSQFVQGVSDFLGIPPKNFIDTYSFTENSIPITGHYSEKYEDYLFHVPQWSDVLLRDVKTLEVLNHPGDKGFIEVLNAYGTNAFAGASVLVDDLAEIIDPEKCPDCGYKGMTIRILGRVKGSEAKGCGATLNVRSEKS